MRFHHSDVIAVGHSGVALDSKIPLGRKRLAQRAASSRPSQQPCLGALFCLAYRRRTPFVICCADITSATLSPSLATRELFAARRPPVATSLLNYRFRVDYPTVLSVDSRRPAMCNAAAVSNRAKPALLFCLSVLRVESNSTKIGQASWALASACLREIC